MHGSFESEKAMQAFVAESVPKPVAWGTYNSHPEHHFFLSEFAEMDDTPISPEDWAQAAANLHNRSRGASPSGRFGFHTTTFLAHVPTESGWGDTWEALYTRRMEGLFAQEELHRGGGNPALTKLRRAFIDIVLPRYLRPLVSDGRSITPCLVHNDLWPGNINPRTGVPGAVWMYDSAAYWAHHEGIPC